MVSGVLKVEVLTEGIHSGDASGVVPSSFRILRQVLDRLEDSKTGRLLPESFHCEIPADRIEQAKATAAILKDEVYKRMPWACGADGGPVLPMTAEPVRGAAQSHLAAHALGHGCRWLPRDEERRQCPAPAYGLQTLLAPAAGDRRQWCGTGAEGAAGRQRALQRQRHLHAGRPCRRAGRYGLEHAGSVAMAVRGDQHRQPDAFRPAGRATSARAAPSP